MQCLGMEEGGPGEVGCGGKDCIDRYLSSVQ